MATGSYINRIHKSGLLDGREVNHMKMIINIIVIGIVSTVIRIIGQMIIPEGTQTILEPSIFSKNGTMPLAFTIYGVLAYSVLASLFLLIKDEVSGNKVMQGLKWGVSCSVVWIIYLLEPLPHVAMLDKITYPIADSIVLLVMGMLSGILLGNDNNNKTKRIDLQYRPILSITVCFVIGRLLQYIVFNSYSSFHEDMASTIVWIIVTGIVLSIAMEWLNEHLPAYKKGINALIIGVVLFGVDLFLFNFFMPLVFDTDIPDLIMRTVVDITGVTIGCLLLKKRQS